MKIPKHIQKYVEGELSNYPINRRALVNAKDNLYLRESLGTYRQAIPMNNYLETNLTQSKETHGLPGRTALYLQNSVSAIEDVLNELPHDYKKLIVLRYFKGYDNQRVATELNICVRNYYNWRDKAIQIFAIRFGLV